MLYEVILDSGETPNKCTIAPLADRPDFRLLPGKGSGPLGPLIAPVLLHHEGECLLTIKKSFDGGVNGIASIDCVWRRLDALLERIAGPLPILGRIPEGFKTVYPRRSAGGSDPVGGLATIEAIFIAGALLGNWDVSLLSEYYFGRKFVEANRDRFLELGVHQAGNPDAVPIMSLRSRNSMQRRHDRGKSRK